MKDVLVFPRRERGPRAALAAMVRGLCPRCWRAAIFAGWMRMHSRCPVCGLTFEREPGYFTGAMYVSYAMGVPVLAVLYCLVALLRPQWSFEAILAAAAGLLLFFVPLLFRYSRIVWIHFDRAIDAGE